MHTASRSNGLFLEFPWSCRRICFWFGVVFALAAGGCSLHPRAVSAPEVDAEGAATEAMTLYDANHDGALDNQELAACPGILAAIGQYDLDNNGSVSETEIADRIAVWQSKGPALLSLDCRVTLDGRPLEGAEVKFVPEPYLKEWIPVGSGTTTANGMVAVSHSPEDLPEQVKRIKTMYAGTYKVEITHPQAKIPEIYNLKTTLGREVSRQTKASPYEEFQLTTK